MNPDRAKDMIGMTRAELDRREKDQRAPAGAPKLRPVDAATLILLDWRSGVPHVLMGRRHSQHVFMPNKFVFPGGRTDPTDGRIRPAEDLHPAERERLMSGRRSVSATRARAIALSAIRETFEEAGYLIGKPGDFRTASPAWSGFVQRGITPALGALRYVARAITPPGRIRRFDTRFLAAPLSAVAVRLPEGGPTNELEEIEWLPIEQAIRADSPPITRVILTELAERLKHDPELSPGAAPIPFYRMGSQSFQRETI